MRASALDGSYPRPQLVRPLWVSLDGPWEFAYDDADIGISRAWQRPGASAFDRAIEVPFPPESPASGIGDTGFHPIVWYRRTIDVARVAGRRVLLHFGAVDHHAIVWVNGERVGEHRGGQVAFSIDITDALREEAPQTVVVRAFDSYDDVELPRGKQDWRREPHAIWYHRTTGIWRSVWLEDVPDLHVRFLDWDFDLPTSSIGYRIRLSAAPPLNASVRLDFSLAGKPLARVETAVRSDRIEGRIQLPALRNAQDRERLLWTPEQPTLIDAAVAIVTVDGRHGDEVFSYLGLRSTTVEAGAFRLNRSPYYMRSVLEQGYWPDTHLASPGPAHLRREVEQIKDLGFNAVRLHQKVEDPRFHYWADRLGLMVWAETAAAYEFTPEAASALMTEWIEIVTQYRNHPSIVTWVPINESWGVQDVADVPAQRSFVRAITEMTRALDPSRPVVSNDGWEHVDSDILTVHDYAGEGAILRERYATRDRVAHLLAGAGPAGRSLAVAAEEAHLAAPLMLTEFGGASYASDATWGYSTVGSDTEFESILRELFEAVHGSDALAGFCYTQLTDTMQEANGLLRADRSPKLDPRFIRSLVMGRLPATD